MARSQTPTALTRLARRFAPAAAGAVLLAAATGCCCGKGGGYGSYYQPAPAYGGGCDTGACGAQPYGAGYGGAVYPQGAMAAPMGQTAAAPVYYQTAAAPAPAYYAPQTAAAPANCVPTY